ncbi:pol-like protein [Apostichopus japonicus]|uniref:Pol-like protein n=1 Tax=Stichopus japonicus TaxID=307972 RepID=A0A2G8JKS3_STIJA|nr:pol-like protein [Apostichopus japonicus]
MGEPSLKRSASSDDSDDDMSSRARLKLTESRRRSFAPLPSHGPYIFSCHFEREWHEGSSQAQSHFPILYFNGSRLRLPQETHILEEDVPLWAYEWGGGLHASFGSSSSCGTVILLSPRQAGCATRVETDHEGRLVCILFKYPQGNISLCNVYAPNRPSARRDFLTPRLPLFLVVLHVSWSETLTVSQTRVLTDSGLLCLLVPTLGSQNWTDSLRTPFSRCLEAYHPCSTVYTWVRPNGEDASRIDRVYAPVSFKFSGCETLSCPLSDHDTVVARFVLPSIFPIGRGLWKLNCRILGEADSARFRDQVQRMANIEAGLCFYIPVVGYIKLRIKRYAIQYCVTRARRRREKFSKLCAEVKFGDPSAVIALQTISMKSTTVPASGPVSKRWKPRSALH